MMNIEPKMKQSQTVPRNDLIYQLGPPNSPRYPLVLATSPLLMRRQMTSSTRVKRRPRSANATLEPPADIRGTSDGPRRRLRLSYGLSTIITGSCCSTAFFVAVVVSPFSDVGKSSALLSGLAGVTVYEDPEGGSLSLTIHGHVFEGVSRKKDLKADTLNGDVLEEKRLHTRRESENTISIGRG